MVKVKNKQKLVKNPYSEKSVTITEVTCFKAFGEFNLKFQIEIFLNKR